MTTTALERFRDDRPLVLVTEYPPDAGGGGAVILRGLLGPGDRAKVVWLSLSKAGADAAPGFLAAELLKSGSAGRRVDGRRSLWLDSTRHAGRVADEIASTARRFHAGALWLVLHGAVVPAAARVAARPGALPYHATVHDDPVGQVGGSRKYRLLTPWYQRAFAASLKGARSVDTICPGMADRYRDRYGVDSVVVHRGTVGPVGPSPAYDPARGLRVGIIGSIYDYAMIPALARAVKIAAGRAGTRGAVVVVGRGVGDRLRDEMGSAVDVEVTGHLDEPEAVERLRGCFLLYANYPFAGRHALFRRTSFPTKVSTYALAARPLLVHAPADSSLLGLTVGTPPGYATHWGSLAEGEGAALLLGLWNDPSAFASAHDAAEAVRSRYYDLERNRSALFDALNGLASPLAGAARR